MAIKRTVTKVKASSKPAHKKVASPKSTAPVKLKSKGAAKPSKPAKHVPVQENISGGAKKVNAVTEVPDSSRLLHETKNTMAALGILEKSLKFLHGKEIKKARIELKLLIESYPAEQEIVARARTFLQICDREEASHKKPVMGNDQLYTMGVMEHNQGNFDGAIAYFRQSLEKNAASDHIYYSLAASFAMKGDPVEAVRNLQKAIELNEENRIFAKNDSDFTPLHGLREFSDLVGWSQPAVSG
jgi:tetratricopeptide (TPR) repeat protein